MVVYNVTISVDLSVEKDWVTWMKEQHIKDVLKTGCFTEARFCRIIGEEEGGATYAVMYLSNTQADLERYQTSFAPKLKQDTQNKFGNKFAAFRTQLSVLEIFKA